MTRAKTNMDFYVVESCPVDKASGVQCDQTIRPQGSYPKQYYPDVFSRVPFYDAELQLSACWPRHHGESNVNSGNRMPVYFGADGVRQACGVEALPLASIA